MEDMRVKDLEDPGVHSMVIVQSCSIIDSNVPGQGVSGRYPRGGYPSEQ